MADVRQLIMTEVESGLRHEQLRLNGARVAQDFYDWDDKKYQNLYGRDAENTFDYRFRSHRTSGLTREVIDVLTEHLYCPGPMRSFSEKAGQEFLDQVYQQNHFDVLALSLDQLSHLHDVAAIQVDAADGVFSEKPLTLRVWGGDQLAVYPDPSDPTKLLAVVTIDEFDCQKRYRLWFDDEVRTYVTSDGGGTSGGRVAVQIADEPHDYGCIPFAFWHFEPPIRKFWNPGISDLIVRAETAINDRLSRLDESINKHLNPILIAKNVAANWQPILEPGRLLKLNSVLARAMAADGASMSDRDPDLSRLELRIDIAGAWEDLRGFLGQILEAARVPQSAVRMEQQGVASGISLLIEQVPLLTRARKRQRPCRIYEENLAKLMLICAGNHYGRADLVAAGKKGMLSLGWPQPSIPVPTPDRLELAVGEVQAGIKSHLMLIQDWYGVDRSQALEIAAQIEKDQADLKKAAPSLAAEPQKPADTPPDQDDQDQSTGSDESDVQDSLEDNEDEELP